MFALVLNTLPTLIFSLFFHIGLSMLSLNGVDPHKQIIRQKLADWNCDKSFGYIVGNKAKGRMSKRVFQGNKPRQIYVRVLIRG